MAETTEAGTPESRPRQGSSGGGSFYTKKLGPMPVWVWMIIILAVVVVYSQWKKNKAAATAQQQQAAGTTNPATDQTPPFIIQNYTSYPGMRQRPPTPTPVPQPQPGPPIPSPPAPVPGPPPPSATPPPTPTSTPHPPPPTVYRVQHGDTLSSIAAKYHTTWQALYAYNTTPGVRSAADIATIKKRGPNLLFGNEEILIPPST